MTDERVPRETRLNERELAGDGVDRGDQRADQRGEQLTGGEVRTGFITGETFGQRPVQYTVVSGRAYVEGDIIVGLDDDLQRRTDELRERATRQLVGVGTEASPGDIVDPRGPTPSVLPRAVVVSGQSRRWPGGIVPYEEHTSLTVPASTAVRQAIAHWHDNTRLSFRERQPADPDWIIFRDADECSSWAGRQGGSQEINLAVNCGRGAAIHEIGHAVGLWHEQSRADRDTFVTILWQNIQAGQAHNFDQHISDGDDVGSYDYGSIMHYGPTDFGTVNPSTGARNTTIVPTGPLPPGVAMGQRNGLSLGDRSAVASIYGWLNPSADNVRLGRFRGQPGRDLLYYSPAPKRWHLGQTVGSTMSFIPVGDTERFGNLGDGRPIWVGDFTVAGKDDVLFYSPSDDNWWLGSYQVVGAEDPQCQPLRGQIADHQTRIRVLQERRNRLNPRDPDEREEIRAINEEIADRYRQIDQAQAQMASLGCPATRDPGGPRLVWSLVGNTIGFGHAINDGRPFWVGDFNGDGKDDILFYHPDSFNWWLGAHDGSTLTWSDVGNTAGFGQIADGRPFWVGDFNGDGKDDILFYSAGDLNWWRAAHSGASLGWLLAGTW